MEPLLDQEKLAELLAIIQPSMPAGVVLKAKCSGRWLELRADYEGNGFTVSAALDLRRLMIKTEVISALRDLSHVAHGIARKLIHGRNEELRAERIALHGECDHSAATGNRGAIKCTICGELMPMFGGACR